MRRSRMLLAIAVFAAPCLMAPVLAQDLETDVVYARQLMMDEIEAQLAPADFAAVGEAFDMTAGRTGASAASAMLGVTPYLFPEGTDETTTAGSDFPALATEAVWQNFEAFTAMANQASQMAFDLSQETDEAEFRSQATALRAVCNSCHAVYMHVPDAPL